MLCRDAAYLMCKDNANREQNHQACLNVMPRCRLSYCRDNANREQNHQVLLECYAEMQLILCAEIMQTESRIIKSRLNVMPVCRLSYCKDNANREQNHQVLLECYACLPLILCRDNANREQNHQVSLECYAEMPLILCKDNANWHNYKIKICQRSHYFSSLPFKMTFFSQFALLHHVLRNIIYDFFINRNTINHSRPIVRNIDMSVTFYSQ